MGYYNVVQQCVVDGKHYIRPAAQPIEADDAEAAPLVESGCLTRYQPGVFESPAIETGLLDEAPRRSRGRRTADGSDGE